MNWADAKIFLEWVDNNRVAIEHFVNGGTVQRRNGDVWNDVDEEIHSGYEYRPKPAKPQVGTLICGYDQTLGVELTPEVEQALKEAGIEI